MFCHLKVFLFLCIVGMVLVVHIIFFSKIPKISFQHFFIMNNTPGNAQRQGAEPRRASTLNAIPSPKPHFHCKHSNFWYAYRMRAIHMPKVNQKNRPFGLRKIRHKKSRPHQTTCNALVYIGLMRTWSFTPLPLYLGRFAAFHAAKRYSITCPCKLYFTPFLLITSWPFSIILTGLPASWSASIELIPVGSVKP